MRIGIGYDIHGLKKGIKLVLGGVWIKHPKGLSGHSDGDVLLHAIVDAALGAAGLGDIGEYFSDKDPRWKGVDSRLFAKETVRLLAGAGLKIQQIDTVILAQSPRLSPYKKRIGESVAHCFGMNISDVGIKAKTHEGFDAIGKGQAIACHAVVLLKKIKKRS